MPRTALPLAAKRKKQLFEHLTYGLAKSDLGWVLVAHSKKGIAAILIGSEKDDLIKDLRRRFPNADAAPGGVTEKRAADKVAAHVKRPHGKLDLPLDLRGTPFQQKIWKTLRAIPAGKTRSYGEIARQVGSPRAVRAVGNACGKNNLAIAIPCHRVLHSDGSLSGGYHWGTDRQAALLTREGARHGREAGHEA